MEKVTLLLTKNPTAPVDGPHILIEAEGSDHREAALAALGMAEKGPYPYIFALDDEGNIPAVNIPPA